MAPEPEQSSHGEVFNDRLDEFADQLAALERFARTTPSTQRAQTQRPTAVEVPRSSVDDNSSHESAFAKFLDPVWSVFKAEIRGCSASTAGNPPNAYAAATAAFPFTTKSGHTFGKARGRGGGSGTDTGEGEGDGRDESQKQHAEKLSARRERQKLRHTAPDGQEKKPSYSGRQELHEARVGRAEPDTDMRSHSRPSSLSTATTSRLGFELVKVQLRYRGPEPEPGGPRSRSPSLVAAGALAKPQSQQEQPRALGLRLRESTGEILFILPDSIVDLHNAEALENRDYAKLIRAGDRVRRASFICGAGRESGMKEAGVWGETGAWGRGRTNSPSKASCGAGVKAVLHAWVERVKQAGGAGSACGPAPGAAVPVLQLELERRTETVGDGVMSIFLRDKNHGEQAEAVEAEDVDSRNRFRGSVRSTENLFRENGSRSGMVPSSKGVPFVPSAATSKSAASSTKPATVVDPFELNTSESAPPGRKVFLYTPDGAGAQDVGEPRRPSREEKQDEKAAAPKLPPPAEVEDRALLNPKIDYLSTKRSTPAATIFAPPAAARPRNSKASKRPKPARRSRSGSSRSRSRSRATPCGPARIDHPRPFTFFSDVGKKNPPEGDAAADSCSSELQKTKKSKFLAQQHKNLRMRSESRKREEERKLKRHARKLSVENEDQYYSRAAKMLHRWEKAQESPSSCSDDGEGDAARVLQKQAERQAAEVRMRNRKIFLDQKRRRKAKRAVLEVGTRRDRSPEDISSAGPRRSTTRRSSGTPSPVKRKQGRSDVPVAPAANRSFLSEEASTMQPPSEWGHDAQFSSEDDSEGGEQPPCPGPGHYNPDFSAVARRGAKQGSSFGRAKREIVEVVGPAPGSPPGPGVEVAVSRVFGSLFYGENKGQSGTTVEGTRTEKHLHQAPPPVPTVPRVATERMRSEQLLQERPLTHVNVQKEIALKFGEPPNLKFGSFAPAPRVKVCGGDEPGEGATGEQQVGAETVQNDVAAAAQRKNTSSATHSGPGKVHQLGPGHYFKPVPFGKDARGAVAMRPTAASGAPSGVALEQGNQKNMKAGEERETKTQMNTNSNSKATSAPRQQQIFAARRECERRLGPGSYFDPTSTATGGPTSGKTVCLSNFAKALPRYRRVRRGGRGRDPARGKQFVVLLSGDKFAGGVLPYELLPPDFDDTQVGGSWRAASSSSSSAPGGGSGNKTQLAISLRSATTMLFYPEGEEDGEATGGASNSGTRRTKSSQHLRAPNFAPPVYGKVSTSRNIGDQQKPGSSSCSSTFLGPGAYEVLPAVRMFQLPRTLGHHGFAKTTGRGRTGGTSGGVRVDRRPIGRSLLDSGVRPHRPTALITRSLSPKKAPHPNLNRGAKSSCRASGIQLPGFDELMRGVRKTAHYGFSSSSGVFSFSRNISFGDFVTMERKKEKRTHQLRVAREPWRFFDCGGWSEVVRAGASGGGPGRQHDGGQLQRSTSEPPSASLPQHVRGTRGSSFAKSNGRHEWRVFPLQKNFNVEDFDDADEAGDVLVLDPADPNKRSKSLGRLVDYGRAEGRGDGGSPEEDPQSDGDVLVLRPHLEFSDEQRLLKEVKGGAAELSKDKRPGIITSATSSGSGGGGEDGDFFVLDVETAQRHLERHGRAADFRFVLGHVGVDYRLESGRTNGGGVNVDEDGRDGDRILLFWEPDVAGRFGEKPSGRGRAGDGYRSA